MANNRGKGGNWQISSSWALKSLRMVDCSHEIRKGLLLGRKAMTNLQCVLKSRDITLPTKVCKVKATVFPVVMYHYKSWNVKKAECQIIDAFELWGWRRLTRRSNQSVLKEINHEYSLEGLMLKLQYFGHLIWTANSLEKTLMLEKIEGRRMRGHQRLRWLDGITNAMHVNLGKLTGDKSEWQGAQACCSPQGCKESDTTGQLNNNNIDRNAD